MVLSNQASPASLNDRRVAPSAVPLKESAADTSGSTRFVTYWFIRLDPPEVGKTVKGQLPILDYQHMIGTRFTQIDVPGRQPQPVQWTGGQPDQVRFTATYFAAGSQVDLIPTYNEVAGMCDCDPRLGRPPRWRFTIGQIEFDCFVQSVGEMSIQHFWADSGLPRELIFPIVLMVIPPEDDAAAPQVQDPTARSPRSAIRIFREHDSYEALCGREYRNPMMGILCLQDDLAASTEETRVFPAPGTVVHLPRPSYYDGKPISPQSHVLEDSDQNRALLNDLNEDRVGVMIKVMPRVVRG